MNRKWLRVAAVLIATMNVVFAIGNLIDDDGGPLFGQLALLGVMLGAAVLVGLGLSRRSRGADNAHLLIGFGLLPGALGVALFWFPPAVIYGLASTAVASVAFTDRSRSEAMAG